MQNDVPYEYSLESISSPSLFHTAFSTSPSSDAAGGLFAVDTTSSPGNSSGRRRSPDELIPLNAPTQARRYVIPSVTSRKDIPAFYTKRRSQSIPSDGEEDELEEERGGIPTNDQEEIERRRRKNTLAARRSRRKKLEQKVELEETVRKLTTEREIWRTRALTLRSLLNSHGITCPDFKD